MGSFMSELSWQRLRSYFRFLSAGDLLRRLEFMWEYQSDEFFTMFFYFLMLFIFVCAIIRVFRWVLSFFTRAPKASTPAKRRSYTGTDENISVRDSDDKYLIQLKGFLENGLIEKSEYDALIQRYRRDHR